MAQGESDEPIYVFTDGACRRNGREGAAASFAAVVVARGEEGGAVAGRVAGREYALDDPSAPEKGFHATAAEAAPTNNRGEYLAWCWGLLALVRRSGGGRAEIVSDCNLFIQTMEKWLPARRAKSEEAARKMKNYDLIAIGEALLRHARQRFSEVRLTHVRSHQKEPPPTEKQAWWLWEGNRRADAAAVAALDEAPADQTPH